MARTIKSFASCRNCKWYLSYLEKWDVADVIATASLTLGTQNAIKVGMLSLTTCLSLNVTD